MLICLNSTFRLARTSRRVTIVVRQPPVMGSNSDESMRPDKIVVAGQSATTSAGLGSVATSPGLVHFERSGDQLERDAPDRCPVEARLPRDRRSGHFKPSSPMIVCCSSTLSRFINGILRRRPGMLGLDHLIGGTLSVCKVATDLGTLSAGHGWYILGGRRGRRPMIRHRAFRFRRFGRIDSRGKVPAPSVFRETPGTSRGSVGSTVTMAA